MEISELVIKPQSSIERIQIFEVLYEQAFPLAARFVRKMGGSLEDARDVFQDALVIYYEKSIQESFLNTTKPEAYILGIVKHLWVKKFRQDFHKVSFSDWEHEIEMPMEENFNNQMLLKFLEQAGRKCLDLLRAFYYEKLTMNEVAQMFGFKNERSATVQKYKCLEKVRDTIKEKSANYEDFIE